MSSSRLSPKLKALVAERAGYCCEYCQSPSDYCPDPFSVEHVLPRVEGGSDDSENLAYSCQGCNGRKYTAMVAADPVTGEMVPLFHPRLNLWRDHFAWSDDFSLIVGLTPLGRATVAKLDLNRMVVRNLRRVLVPPGIHPPNQEA